MKFTMMKLICRLKFSDTKYLFLAQLLVLKQTIFVLAFAELSNKYYCLNSAVILEIYGEQFFSEGFSTDYGRYRSQLTTKKKS